MEKLTKEQVVHVAKLARLEISEIEIDHYATQLADILTEIEKIKQVPITETEVLISPITHMDRYQKEEMHMTPKSELFKNSNHKNSNYIVVPKVLND